MISDDNTGLIISVILILFIFLSFLIGGFLSAYSCQSRWSDSGIESSWGIVKGCTIKNKEGRFIPEGNYREI